MLNDDARTGILLLFVLTFAVLCICAGCIRWGSGELVSHRSAMLLDAASDVYEEAEEIIELAEEVECKEIIEHAESIQEDAQDIAERAEVAQAHSGPPKEEVERGSEEDSYLFNADAGQGHTKVKRREFIREAPDKVAGFAANVAEKATRGLWDRLPFAVQAFAVLALAFWLRKLWVRQGQHEGVTVRLIDKALPEKEDRRVVSEGTPVQDRYRKERGKEVQHEA